MTAINNASSAVTPQAAKSRDWTFSEGRLDINGDMGA